MAKRSAAGASSPAGLCGGTEAGTKSTRSSSMNSQISSAMSRWPKWMGLKVPLTPRREATPGYSGSARRRARRTSWWWLANAHRARAWSLDVEMPISAPMPN